MPAKKYIVEVELNSLPGNSDKEPPTADELKLAIGREIISNELGGYSILKLTMIDPPETPKPEKRKE